MIGAGCHRARICAIVRRIAGDPSALSAQNVEHTAAMRRLLDRHARMVAVAALREIARPVPSWPDVAALLRCSHTTAMDDWERWSAMPWRDRSNWLDLVERMLRAEGDHE